MVQIDNSTIYNSLYRVQSQMKYLSDATNLNNESSIYQRNLISSISPAQLQSKILKFQQDNLNINNSLIAQLRNQQLTQANLLSGSQPSIVNLTSPTTMSIASTSPAPMTMSIASTSPAPMTMSVASTSPAPMTMSIASITVEPISTMNYTMSILASSRIWNSLGTPVKQDPIENEKTRQKFIADYNEFKSLADSKYHLENVFGIDPFADQYHTTAEGNASLRDMFFAIGQTMRTDLKELEKDPNNYQNNEEFVALSKIMWEAKNFKYDSGFSYISNKSSVTKYYTAFKRDADEKYHFENTHGFVNDYESYRYEKDQAKFLSMVQDNMDVWTNDFKILHPTPIATDPPLAVDPNQPISGNPTIELNPAEKLANSILALSKLWLSVLRADPLDPETQEENREKFINDYKEYKSITDSEYHLESLFGINPSWDIFHKTTEGNAELLDKISQLEQSMRSIVQELPVPFSKVTLMKNMWENVVKMNMGDDNRDESFYDVYNQIDIFFPGSKNEHLLFLNNYLEIYEFSSNFNRLEVMNDIKNTFTTMGEDPSVLYEDIDRLINPPAQTGQDYEKTEQYKALLEFQDYVKTMPLIEYMMEADAVVSTFNKAIDAYNLKVDEKYQFNNSHNYNPISQDLLNSEDGRVLLLSMISDNFYAMKADANPASTNPPITVEPNQPIIIIPPVSAEPTQPLTETQRILTDMWNFAVRMPLNNEGSDERYQEFLGLNNEFKAVADSNLHFSDNEFNARKHFSSESSRQVLLEAIRVKMVETGLNPSDILGLIAPPKEVGAEYQLTESYGILRKMWNYATTMSLSKDPVEVEKHRTEFNKLNDEYLLLQRDGTYELGYTHGFSSKLTDYYKNGEAGQYVLQSMISDVLHAIKRDTVGEDPPIEETPGDSNPIGNPNPIGTPPGLNLDELKNRILDIKVEYNNNQISVYTQEYTRIMETSEAKAKSELTKLQLLEQTNLWLLDNNTQRKSNLFMLINP